MSVRWKAWLGCASAFAALFAALPSFSAPPAFAPYVAFPAPRAEAVAIADLDGDGRNDVVVTQPGALLLYFQQANGELAALLSLTGGNAYSVATGDFNGDGRVDIATTSSTGGVIWYAGAGNRNFTLASTLGVAGYRAIVAADMNGDGRLDLVAMQWSANELHLYYQLSSGGFSAATPVTAPMGGWNDMKIGDINGDSRNDIVYSSAQNPGGTQLGIVVQRADGAFEPPFYSAYPFDTLFIRGVGVTDVNGDGAVDIVVAAGIVIALFNQGGSFDKGVVVPGYGSAQTVNIGDVDLDGLDDVVVLHGGWLKAGVYPRMPGGGLASEALFTIPYASHYNPQGLAIGDINGDGRPDLAIADYNSGLVVLYNLTGGCPPFGDIDGTSAFCPNAEWLYNRAITEGCSTAALYCPGPAVTRLAMAAFLDRLGTVMSDETLAAQQAPITAFPGFTTVLCTTSSLTATDYPRRAEIDIVFTASSTTDVDLMLTPVSGSFPFWTVIGAPTRITVPANRWSNTRLIYSLDVDALQTVAPGVRVEYATGSGPTLSGATCNVRARIANRNG